MSMLSFILMVARFDSGSQRPTLEPGAYCPVLAVDGRHSLQFEPRSIPAMMRACRGLSNIIAGRQRQTTSTLQSRLRNACFLSFSIQATVPYDAGSCLGNSYTPMKYLTTHPNLFLKSPQDGKTILIRAHICGAYCGALTQLKVPHAMARLQQCAAHEDGDTVDFWSLVKRIHAERHV